MARGYTSVDAVEAYMGRTFTADQELAAVPLLDAVEAYIDRVTHKGWILAPITGEIHWLTSPTLYLTHAPVTSVQGISVRSSFVGDTPVVLVNLTDYELIEPGVGMVRLSAAYGRGSFATVSYTPNLPVPADITLAATEIVAATMYPAIFPDRLGFASAQADASTRISYTHDGREITIPKHATAILEGYIRPVGYGVS